MKCWWRWKGVVGMGSRDGEGIYGPFEREIERKLREKREERRRVKKEVRRTLHPPHHLPISLLPSLCLDG
jgi:hypothetical protein